MKGDATPRMIADWPKARLGDLATYINGRAFKPSDWGVSGLPIIRIQNLTDSSAPFNWYSGGFSDRHFIRNGDLLVSWSASLDAYIWNRGDAILNQHIFKVLENTSLVDRQYLYFAIREVMEEIRDQTHGATMKHINKPEFEAIEISLPPLSHQKLIAKVLKTKFAAVESLRQAGKARLEAIRELPIAYLREAFESDEVAEWNRRALSEVASLLPSKSIKTNGNMVVVAITTACLTELGFNQSGAKTARMDSRDADISKLKVGEVLIARSNTPELVGRTSVFRGFPEGAVASDLTIRVWPNEYLDSDFLGYYLSYLFLTGYWRDNAGGASGTMKKITRTQIQGLSIPIPDLVIQTRIKRHLKAKFSLIDRLLRQITDEAKATEMLSYSLLRQVFSGAI